MSSDCREHDARLMFMHGKAGSARYFGGRKLQSARVAIVLGAIASICLIAVILLL